MTQDQQDARHPASALQIRQAQQRGDFPRSNEVASSFQLLCGIIACYLLISNMGAQVVEYTQNIWSTKTINVGTDLSELPFGNWMGQLLLLVAPLFGLVLLIGLLSHFAQNTSFSFFNKPLFNASSLNPTSNMQKLYSLENGLRGVLALPKLILTLSVAAATVWYLATKIQYLAYTPVRDMAKQLVDCVFAVLIASTATMFLISTVDYLIERMAFLRRNRMTDEQLRDEHRLQNVDPQLTLRRQKIYESR